MLKKEKEDKIVWFPLKAIGECISLAFIRKCGYPKVKEDPLVNWVGFSTNTTKFSSKCNQIMFASHVDRGWPMFEILDRAKMNSNALYVVLIEKHECKIWMQQHFIQVDRRFELFRIDDEVSMRSQCQILFEERRNRVHLNVKLISIWW